MRTVNHAFVAISALIAAAASFAQCYDIAPVNEVYPTLPCAAGQPCYGNCAVHDSWVPGDDCAVIASCGSKKVICYPGTTFLNQFGQCVCMGLNLNAPTSVTVGIPCCFGDCGGGER